MDNAIEATMRSLRANPRLRNNMENPKYRSAVQELARKTLLTSGRHMGVKSLKKLTDRFHEKIRRGEIPSYLNFYSDVGLQKGDSRLATVTENRQESLLSDITNLLVAAKASGISEMDTTELVGNLVNMGHSVTPQSLVELFSEERPEVIKNITVQKVTLDTTDPVAEPDEGDQEDFERDVSKQAMDNIKRRAKQRKDVQL